MSYGKTDEYVTRSELAAKEAPEVMGPRHNPVLFADYIDLTMDAVKDYDMVITEECHVLSHGGKRFFSNFRITRGTDMDQLHGHCLALRGAHDQSLPRGMSAGAFVFTCTNLQIFGDLLNAKTKQTTFINDRLKDFIYHGVERLEDAYREIDDKYAAYQETNVTDRDAYETFAKGFRRRALTSAGMGKAINEWHRPSDAPEDNQGTAWGVLNAMTHANKGTPSALVASNRTATMAKLMDELVPV
jgi:hypothetical protein